MLNPFLGHRRPTVKQDPYECGLPSEVKRDLRFGISFYLIAMLFILFDIEVDLPVPDRRELRAFGSFALAETIVFIVLLLVAFGYVWRRGALEWRVKPRSARQSASTTSASASCAPATCCAATSRARTSSATSRSAC